MDRTKIAGFAERERRIYALISRSDGLKAREIARELNLSREEVNREFFQSPLIREMCYRKANHCC